MKAFAIGLFVSLWMPVLALVMSDLHGVPLGEMFAAMPSVMMVFAGVAAGMVAVYWIAVEIWGRWDEWIDGSGKLSLWRRWRH